MGTRLRAVAYGMTDVGLQREHNEDSYAVLEEFDLFIVADGMGGHKAGDVASRLATSAIGDFFKSTQKEDVTWPFHFDTNLSEEENRLVTGIRIANRQIFERSIRSRDCQGMGTTVVGALFAPKKRRIFVGHVGDSRAYRVRDGNIEQLTRDHSLANDLMGMPGISEEDRAEVPKNIITRALGMQDQVMVDLISDDTQKGDIYLLCSDGLSGMMSDEEILAEVESGKDQPQDICDRLIKRANEHGGEDNITALVIRLEELEVDAPAPEKKAPPEEPEPPSVRTG